MKAPRGGNEWLTAGNLPGLRLADLLRLIRQAVEASNGALKIPAIETKAEALRWVEAARRRHWNAGGARPETGNLSATECNRMLRSLPPVPLWGEGLEDRWK